MTNATPNSLMRRTKAELVNIILRKDETEAKAAEEIKALNKKVSDYKDHVQCVKDSYNDVISTLKADNKKLKNTLIYSYVAFAAIIIIMLL